MRLSRLLLTSVAWAVFGTSFVSAQTLTGSYDVSHGFTFAPSGGVTSLPLFNFGAFASTSPGGAPDIQSGSDTFGLGGGPLSHTASSTGPFSSATATSSATLSPFVLGGPVSGIVRSSGAVSATGPGTCCAASFDTMVFPLLPIGAGHAAILGSIGYAPDIMSLWNAYPHSEPSAVCPHPGGDLCDPVDFKVTDLKTGVVTSGSLFSVSSDMGGSGSFSWDTGTFDLNASDFDFSIRIDSPFTVQQGTADLKVDNGLITVSAGTGMFAGLFPAVGSSGDFTIPFDNNFVLDYNLGDFNGDPLAAQFFLGGSGQACFIPEPATWAMMMLGFAGLGYAAFRRSRKNSIAYTTA
jgi:PEP-CTERM motif